VIDAHTHFRGDEPLAHYLDNLALCGHDAASCSRAMRAATGREAYAFRCWDDFRTPALAARFYIFGGLSTTRSAWRAATAQPGPAGGRFAGAGFDGIKMMEGSPYGRRNCRTRSTMRTSGRSGTPAEHAASRSRSISATRSTIGAGPTWRRHTATPPRRRRTLREAEGARRAPEAAHHLRDFCSGAH